MGTQHAGFVDIQVNGYLGVSFSADDLTVERCAEACRTVLSRGGCAATVSYTHLTLPTICSV